MNRSFRAPERGKMAGSLGMKDNKDDDLALFREMRKREKERNNLLQNTDEFAPLGPITGNSPVFSVTSATPAAPRKTGADDFLNSDNDKNDYEWLLTPPGTPLFPHLEMESQKTIMSQLGSPKAHPTASLKSRLANPQPEPTGRSNLSSRHPTSTPGLNTSSNGLHRPSSSGSRPATPTGRPTLSSTTKSTSNKATSNIASKPSSTTSPRITSRSATPTSHHSLPYVKKPTVPPMSSTPTARSTVRSSTPTSIQSLPTSKSTSRSATPTHRPTTTSSAPTKPAIPVKSPTSTSVAKPVLKNPVQPRSSSPLLRPKAWKPSEMPRFSLDVPPNLRTSLSDRPPSATRGRPGAPSSRSSSIEPVSNGRIRRQSCSPSRGRLPNGIMHNSGSSVPVSAANRLHAKANDNVSPGLYGTKMVERVINMRKLIPPKQDDKHSPHSNLSGKSSSPDSSGFGRNLSKKSLDMAMRHMDIRRTIPGNLRPLMNNIPASSLYSVRSSGSTQKRTVSVSDSPLATSSNGSSEVSVNNNNALCMDGHELDDDVSSHKSHRSHASLCGR